MAHNSWPALLGTGEYRFHPLLIVIHYMHDHLAIACDQIMLVDEHIANRMHGVSQSWYLAYVPCFNFTCRSVRTWKLAQQDVITS